MSRRVHGLARRAVLLLALLLSVGGAAADLDLQALARSAGGARIVCEVTFAEPLARSHVPRLKQLGLHPTRPFREFVGQETGLFATRAGQALRAVRDPLVAGVEWVRSYPQAAEYSIHFQYVGEHTLPELTFTIAAPRSATGRTLTALQAHLEPPAEPTIATDEAGNRFLTMTYREIEPGQMFLFDFAGEYDFDSEAILQGSVVMLGATWMPESWPGEVEEFLRPGLHIESDASEIVSAAMPLSQTDRLDERIRNVLDFVRANVEYDTPKRDGYFGGKFVYEDAWEMWQGALGTLRRGMGCCPDSAELKVALLRACGIPARTAVHTGHLYAEVWVPGRGWLTDGPMSKTPLIRSPGADNTSYTAWEPACRVRCARWSGRLQPFGEMSAEGEGWIELAVE